MTGPVLHCILTQKVFGDLGILAHEYCVAVPGTGKKREVRAHVRAERFSKHIHDFHLSNRERRWRPIECGLERMTVK